MVSFPGGRPRLGITRGSAVAVLEDGCCVATCTEKTRLTLIRFVKRWTMIRWYICWGGRLSGTIHGVCRGKARFLGCRSGRRCFIRKMVITWLGRAILGTHHTWHRWEVLWLKDVPRHGCKLVYYTTLMFLNILGLDAAHGAFSTT